MASTLCVKIITVILIALIITSYVIEMIEGHKAASKIHVAMGPIVSVRDGKVRPRLMESRFDKKYYGFLGIPYAAPPTTFMRFQPPSVPLPWSDVLNATQYGPKCIQYDQKNDKVIGEEDCLYLNIFTPKVEIEDSIYKNKQSQNPDTYSDDIDEYGNYYPVIVFLHGGTAGSSAPSFMTGSASTYDASYFMDEEVVIVTLNYRLGPFGFLSTGNDIVSGNMGLKDQVMALKWIQENIHVFFGNKNSVTLIGNTAGGASVHYHMLSPMSRGLFHKGISMSGTALCSWAFTRQPRSSLRQLGTLLNCPTTDVAELVDCLRIKDATEIAQQHKNFIEWNSDPVSPFSPTVEYSLNEVDVFLKDSPYMTIQKQYLQDQIPWVIGITDDEGVFYSTKILTDRKLAAEMNEDWNRVAPLAFFYRDSALERDAVSNQLRTFYFEQKDIGNATQTNLTNLYSDRYFCHCTRLAALLHKKYNEGTSIYLYYFGQKSSRSILNSLGIHHQYVAANGDDLQYLFKINTSPIYPAIGKTNKYTSFSKSFIKLWMSFARTSVPTATWLPEINWNPIQSEEVKGEVMLKYYKLDKNTSFVDEPFAARMAFWDRLPLNEFEDEELSVFSRKAYRA